MADRQVVSARRLAEDPEARQQGHLVEVLVLQPVIVVLEACPIIPFARLMK
jgi:hypothetical protein